MNQQGQNSAERSRSGGADKIWSDTMLAEAQRSRAPIQRMDTVSG